MRRESIEVILISERVFKLSTPPVSSLPKESKNWTPIAFKKPIPPSFVALPPKPIIICSAPSSVAASMSSPTPKLEVFIGFLFLSVTRCKPQASAISITAVFELPSIPHLALIYSPVGPDTFVEKYLP